MTLEKTSGLRIDGFELTLRDIALVNIEQLHALSIGVGWPHRPNDWQMLLELGRGFAAVDEIGRVVGSVMWLRYGADFTMVGMLITSPRLQAQGAGHWLMERVQELNCDTSFGLTATRAARRLYRSLNYRYEQKILQCQGEAVLPRDTPPPPHGVVRPIAPNDHETLLQLDRVATGCDRSVVLRRLLSGSQGYVLIRHDEVAAFSLCRGFGRGHVIGPVIAASEADAVAVSLPHVREHVGRFLRVDTPESNALYSGFLAASGMPVFDFVISMGLKRPPYVPMSAEGPRRIALASQGLG
jgi:GNAT superfamily N-acetyltransferase